MKRLLILVLWLNGSMLPLWAQTLISDKPEAFLSWSRQHAVEVGKGSMAKGRVSGSRGLLHTERSRDYKLRATWLTPDVIRAAARLAQLSQRLTDEQTASLVKEAERAGDTVVMVEIDPREGSGVVPNDWQAFLQPKGEPALAVAGLKKPSMRDIKALNGVSPRDYDYDSFWVVFPLRGPHNARLFSDSVREAELVVSIHGKEGRLIWPIPESIRARIRLLTREQ